MVSTTLVWTPIFEVGRKHNLDHLITRAEFPTLPAAGQELYISCYLLENKTEPEPIADYFKFLVERIDYCLEKPGCPIEATVILELIEDDDDVQSLACEVLTKVYKWQKEK